MTHTIGLFGTCSNSTWRADLIAEFKRLGGDFNYYNPQLPHGTWTPACAVEEAKHLASDDIIVMPITGDGYGFGSMAEVGMTIASVITSPHKRYAIIYIDSTVNATLAVNATVLAAESHNVRSLLKAHLRNFKHERVIVLEKLEDLIHAILDSLDSLENDHHIKHKWLNN